MNILILVITLIKKGSFRRIIVASIAFIFVVIALYLFPQNEIKIPSKTIYKKIKTSGVYLLDKNDYVARTSININNKDTLSKAKEVIEALISGTNKNKYIPRNFKSTINKNVTINNISIENDTVIVDFSSNLFDNCNEEKTLESIVYTLTEINGINHVKILLDGKILDKLPSLNKPLSPLLDRSIGINKKSSFSSIKNIQEVTTYFMNKDEELTYYIPVTFITNDNTDKISIIIKELTGKDNIDPNLSTYIAAGTELKNYEILENELSLEFNSEILNNFNKINEEVIYGVALSIYDNYNISKVSFNVNNQKIDEYELKTS